MKLHRGDVVLLAFPFSGGQGSKVRPGLVIRAMPRAIVFRRQLSP